MTNHNDDGDDNIAIYNFFVTVYLNSIKTIYFTGWIVFNVSIKQKIMW